MSSQGRLLSTLLAAIADFERDLIRERTGEGRKRALANGVKFGAGGDCQVLWRRYFDDFEAVAG
jgi:DNA invertase Pin-like site-specific DNA recombinase